MITGEGEIIIYKILPLGPPPLEKEGEDKERGAGAPLGLPFWRWWGFFLELATEDTRAGEGGKENYRGVAVWGLNIKDKVEIKGGGLN